MLNLANLKWCNGFLPNLQSIPNSPQYIDSCFFLTGKSTFFFVFDSLNAENVDPSITYWYAK